MHNKLVLLTTLVAGLSSFSAAAEQNSKTLAQAEIAAVPAAPMRLNVQGRCQNGTPTFFLKNNGEKWPRTALVKLYFADDNSPIGQRRVRLKERQKISLAVKSGVYQNRPLGLWVEPSWYNRHFKFDARLTCTATPSS